jgi:hypothetical protein
MKNSLDAAHEEPDAAHEGTPRPTFAEVSQTPFNSPTFVKSSSRAGRLPPTFL